MAITFVAGLASVGSAMIAAGGLISIGAAFGAFAIGAGLSLVSRALAPSPDLGAQMAGQSVMTRDAAHSRKIVYGRARIGGNVVYLESTGTDNKYLWLVTAIAGHEIDAYEQVWFNDQKVWENGNFTSAWATQGNSATSPYIDIGFYKGDQTTADNNAQRGSASLVENSTKWTDNHKLLGTAYMVVKLTYDQDKFAQGLPNISTVIRGKKVYDAQKDSTSPYYESSLGVSTQRENNSATWQWSQNPALCIRDYLVDVRYGLGESVDNILRSSIDTATDVCNETITLSDTTSQVRYTMDGVIDTGNSIKANIENMTGAMIGRLVYSGGKFELHAGKYVAPTVTIDESMIIGEISVQTKQSRRNAYNGVKGVFLSETDNYILADYPAQISSTYAAQDGDPIYLDMPLPYTVNNIRAQRLAKLALQRSRQQEAITIPCNLNALKFKIGDNISVTNTRLGYSGKVFEVVGYSMGFSSDQMVVNVEAIETAASIWDWATSDEEVFLGAGEVDLYDGTVAIAPASVSVAGDSFLAADGTFSTSFNVSWPDAVDAFTDHYVVEHKLTTASDYFSQQTKSSPFTIIGLQNGQQYNVRLKAVNGIGVSSAYVSATQTAATDTTAPSLPTSITATAGYKSISLVWTNPSEKDFDHVEIHRATTSNGTYVQVSIAKGGFGAKSEHLDGGLADATAFYYKFKSVDRSDNKTSDSDFNGQTPVNATTDAASIDGEDGFNTANVYAYKRSSTAVTDQPSTARTWTFSSGTWNNNDLGNSFTGLIPTGTDDLYVCSAVAKSRQTTDEVIVSDWSPARLFSSNGTNGTNGDDGAAGVRNASGYVYYSLSSATSPSTPSATAYNYTTGVFTGLTNNWSRTPPVNTGSDAKYWASTYYVSEATYAGTQTITFNAAFSSFSFDGLVTFTSLNTALANTGGDVTTIDGGLITTDTITVNKLTGDVTEVYPIAQRFYTNTGGEQLLTNVATIFSNFSIPAPALNIAKRQKIDLNLFFLIENTGQSPVDYSQITLTVQKKSKGSTPVQITSTGNKVTVESESIPYNQIISLPFNALETLDVSGGVSNSSSPSTVGDIRSIYYDLSANKTYLMISTSSDIFSTNDDLYFSSDSFTSTGTWFSPDTFDDYWVNTPIDANASYVTQATISNYHQKGRSTFVIPWKVSYGRSTTGSEYRLRASISNPQSGVTYALLKMTGTLENIS
jgi:hypothetical protein